MIESGIKIVEVSVDRGVRGTKKMKDAENFMLRLVKEGAMCPLPEVLFHLAGGETGLKEVPIENKREIVRRFGFNKELEDSIGDRQLQEVWLEAVIQSKIKNCFPSCIVVEILADGLSCVWDKWTEKKFRRALKPFKDWRNPLMAVVVNHGLSTGMQPGVPSFAIGTEEDLQILLDFPHMWQWVYSKEEVLDPRLFDYKIKCCKRCGLIGSTKGGDGWTSFNSAARLVKGVHLGCSEDKKNVEEDFWRDVINNNESPEKVKNDLEKLRVWLKDLNFSRYSMSPDEVVLPHHGAVEFSTKKVRLMAVIIWGTPEEIRENFVESHRYIVDGRKCSLGNKTFHAF